MGSWRPDPLKTLGRSLIAALVVVGLHLSAPTARAQDELAQRNQARAFADLVVRVLPQRRDGTAAAATQGFGIIVARRGQDLIIATPRHVVFDDAFTATPNVRFRADQFSDVPATRLDRSSAPDDLAWLTVRPPAGTTIPTVPLVAPDRLANRFVWGIGSGGDWEMSPRGGTYEGEDPVSRRDRFGGLDTIPGSSGGLVVTADGVAAMILSTSGRRTFGLPLQRIQQLLPAFFAQTQWLLQTPSPTPAPSEVARTYLTFFGFESSTVNERGRSVILESIRNAQRIFPVIIEITGHTDTAESNQLMLSNMRAQSVRQIAIDFGFPASAISSSGVGSQQLLVPTGLNVREPQNRRVEIVIR
jgi:outer membrane protein OmpA-like peptidoglycan-associated protein